MLKVTIFALCLAGAWAAPLEEPVPIISQESDVDVDGSFHYSFESGDGTKVHQEGELKDVEDGPGEVMRGFYEYVGADGQTHHVDYTADENGFRATGDIIPEIPPEIQKALEYNAAHPEEDK